MLVSTQDLKNQAVELSQRLGVFFSIEYSLVADTDTPCQARLELRLPATNGLLDDSLAFLPVYLLEEKLHSRWGYQAPSGLHRTRRKDFLSFNWLALELAVFSALVCDLRILAEAKFHYQLILRKPEDFLAD